ncbi:peroxiredoxin [Clavulina sp. PMI_390]|nr:peroxiredoxin [Clavulina sp. PMI_390]
MSKAFVQRPAPAFTAQVVEEGLFKDISLEQYKGKWVVLFFYPMDFTFVCPTEILGFDKALPKFRAIDTEVFAISTDSVYAHLAWSNLSRKEGGVGPDLKLPLIADPSHKISRDYGVLLEDEGIALRGLFIIDPKGTLRQMTINDLSVGRSVDETIRLVKALQFTDKHGEVCPVNWQEGGDTIKPDPKESLDYFSATDKKRRAEDSTMDVDNAKRTKV